MPGSWPYSSECRHLLLSGGRRPNGLSSSERFGSPVQAGHWRSLRTDLLVCRAARAVLIEAASTRANARGPVPLTRRALDQDRRLILVALGRSSGALLGGQRRVTEIRTSSWPPGIARLEPGGSRDGGVQMSGFMAGGRWLS